MAPLTILDHLDRLAASRPLDAAIDFEGACTTYAALASDVKVLSRSLAARGVRPGPKSFTVCLELPMLAVGKVDRGALKREAAERAEITSSVRPRRLGPSSRA